MPTGDRQAWSFSKHHRSLPHREGILAGENKVQSAAIGAHPFGGETRRVARTYVPIIRVKGEEPWSPRPRCFVNGEAPVEADVDFASAVARAGVRFCMDQKETIQAGVKGHVCAITAAGSGKHAASLREIRRP